MSKFKRRVRWALLNVVWIGSLIYGFSFGIDGLKNIGLFLSWWTIFMGFVTPTDGVIELVVKKGGFSVPYWVENTVNIFATAILLWYGCIATAVFLSLAAMFITTAYMKVEEKMDNVGDEPSELFDELVENDEQESSPIS